MRFFKQNLGVFLTQIFIMRKAVTQMRFASAVCKRLLTWGYITWILVLTKAMSVVGPRPALPNEVATYNDYQRQRLLVKPGMTCYWQTRRNRDSITFDEWVDLDL